jgi:general secretion pathway protein D
MVIVGLVVVFIIWKVGFYKSPAKPAGKGGVAKLASEANEPRDVQKPTEANAPKLASGAVGPERLAGVGEPNRPVGRRRPGGMRGSDRMSRFDEQEGFGGMELPSAEQMQKMRQRFENMSPEEREKEIEKMKQRLENISPEEREKMRQQFQGAGGPPPSFGPPGFVEPNAPGGVREPNEVRRAFEPNRPASYSGIRGPAGPNEPMEALNLKDVEMRSIIQKLAEWTGKVIIPTQEAMQQKVTIYAAEKMPRSQALAHIYSALRMKGYVAEQSDNAIYLTPMKDAKLGFVPTIPAGQPLALIENKEQIVQKFFKLESYKPTQMGQVIQPLIGEHGYVSADETTGTLLVIDTVSNLMRLERIITEFDVPEAGQTVTQIFTVQHGDPAEIVQLLKMLLSAGDTRSSSSGSGRGMDRERMDRERFMPPGMGQPSSGEGAARAESKTTGGATSVTVGKVQGTVVLIPESKRKWIIARASAEAIKQIGEWIQKLDIEGPVESEYEVVPLMYANPEDVQKGIEQAMKDMPGAGLTPSVVVEPLERQVLVAGRKDLRDLVKKLIEEIDVPPGLLQTEHFKLKYADPDQIKTNVEELYSSGALSSSGGRRSFDFGYGGYGGSSRTTRQSSDTVKVISYVSLRQITVIASPENLEKIRKQIEVWDKQLDVNEVKPRIIELHNSDPVKMADLLTTLFSEKSTSSRTSFFEMMFGGAQTNQKIVGALYGQLTFEDVPGTKKIIIISKIPEAYDVVEELVRDLDKQEMGEVPKVITLKYADPEDLAERLNAMFNQPGTSAPIRRSAQGLSSTSTTSSQSSSTQSSSSSSQGGTTGAAGGGSSSTTTYTPPWSGQGARSTTTEEMPISNVIGKVRFVPETHSKSLLVLAPPEFMPNIEALVQELDIPGKQVMVKAVIVEVKHSDVTSLGLQLASDPGAFGILNENSITALNTLKLLESHGASLIGTGTSASLNVGNRSDTTTTASITALIDFLVKKIHAKILNQQTLWTKDNGEAIFFKGDNVALQTAASVSGTTGMTTSSYEFNRVGMTLRVRPRITPEKNVDMVLNIILSQLTSEKVNNQPKRTEMETTTNMIVQNGQTVMLGGILFQQDSKIERKLPLLGDLPLAGGLFRHNSVEQSNNELIVFVTPYVIDEGQKISPEASQEMAQPMERLKEVQKQLKDTAERLEQPSQQEQD